MTGSVRCALCLSGGGFRALHWHLGSLAELNRRGLLAKLDTISGVSAGALCAAWLGLRWGRLNFDGNGVATNLDDEAVVPLRAFAQNRIGVAAALGSFVAPLGWANALVVGDLDRLLYRGAKLDDLSRRPRIVINAVELETAEPVRFSHHGGQHGRHGVFSAEATSVATAVAASCAFPPFFAPAIVPVTDQAWERAADPPARLLLGDGVLEDNTALEAVWPDHDVLLLSDAGLPCKLATAIRPAWHSILLHTQRVQFHHARLSRLRRLREQFAAGLKRGAYWGLSGDCFGCVNDSGTGALPGERGADLGTASLGMGLNAPDEVQQLWRTPANFLRLRPAMQATLEAQSQRLAAEALDNLAL